MTTNERNIIRELIDQARRRHIRSQPGCVSCGTPYDEHNTGCWHCNERHRKRRQRGNRMAGIRYGWCVGCGHRYDEPLDGCLSCIERQRGRRRRAEARLA